VDDDEARAGQVRVGVVDDRVVLLARDSYLIEQNVARSLGAHFPTPRGRDHSLEKPALLQKTMV